MRSFGKHSLFFNAFKESACQAGDMGLIPGLGRPPGEGNSNPLQYSCLGNPTGSQDSDTTNQLTN